MSAHPNARRWWVLLVALVVGLLLAPAPASARHRPPHHGGTVTVRVIGFNDFHGNLEPPSGSSGRVTTAPGVTVDAGGAAYLATHIKQLRADADHSVVVAAGDSIGASPLASALFHDEPTIAVLNTFGMTASAVGNHEFDEGYAELRRIQRGGCHPTDGCQFTPRFRGANFPYLGANVYRKGRPALLPFTVTVRDRVPIGFIGVTLEDLPSVVTPEAIKGLTFGDEVEAINRTSRQLTRLGVKAQVVLMHQGDNTSGGGPDTCSVTSDIGQEIARRATPAVDAFFTGHSHQQYNCSVTDPARHPRPVIQGLSFGRLLSTVDLTIDKRSRDVLRDTDGGHERRRHPHRDPGPAGSGHRGQRGGRSRPRSPTGRSARSPLPSPGTRRRPGRPRSAT